MVEVSTSNDGNANESEGVNFENTVSVEDADGSLCGRICELSSCATVLPSLCCSPFQTTTKTK